MATSLVNTSRFLGTAILQPLVGWAIGAQRERLPNWHRAAIRLCLVRLAGGIFYNRDELPLSVRLADNAAAVVQGKFNCSSVPIPVVLA
jgi:hypothetical protein